MSALGHSGVESEPSFFVFMLLQADLAPSNSTVNARIELERQISHNSGGVSSGGGGGQVSFTTPLGFGAEDVKNVRPGFWKRSRSGKSGNGGGGKVRKDFASQIHVETL